MFTKKPSKPYLGTDTTQLGYLGQFGIVQKFLGDHRGAPLDRPLFKHIPKSLFEITFDEGRYRSEGRVFARTLRE